MWNKTEKRPIAQFLLLTFAIAWGSEAVLIVIGHFKLFTENMDIFFTYILVCLGAGFAPAYAFYIVLRLHKKIHGFRDFLKIVFKADNIRLTVIITVLIMLSQLLIYIVCEEYIGNPWYCFILFIPLMIIGGGIEEVGWLGFLQPALETKMPLPAVDFLEGVLWSIWHLPLWFVPNTTQNAMNFLSFTVYCIVFNFVLAASYRVTKSVWAGVIIHAWGNVIYGGMFTFHTLTSLPSVKLLVIYCLEIIATIIISQYTTNSKFKKHAT
jgi:membrane protease YdiL (CAAX protease family)